MQTFSEQIKQEICLFEYDNITEKSILLSFLTNSLNFNLTSEGEIWEIKSQFNLIIRFIGNIFSNLYDVDKLILFSNIKKLNNRRDYILQIKGNFKQIINDLGLENKIMETKNFTSKQEKGYLIGSFLSGGSISSIKNKNYHLEIRSNNIVYLRNIQNVLNKFNIFGTLLKRKKNYFLYVKKANDISDFLKLIGANNSMLELEDKKISRDIFNQIHRLNNIDISNIKKASNAGNWQVKKIQKIINKKIFEKQNEKFKIFCRIRLENPDCSLSEISKIFMKKHKIKISRTSVNHYVNKLKSI